MADNPYDGLEPALVWKYFSDFNTIARPSGQESRMANYIQGIALAHGFNAAVDAAGNVRVRVPASPGLEGKPRIILQGHMDMVCSRDSDAGEFDPTLGHIKVFRATVQGNVATEDPNGEWIEAFKTTLGADDGVGSAAMLAVATDPAVKHGPLDLLFTIKEEDGLVGAANLDPTIIDGKVMLNLDSEDEGIFTIGSAGGRETRASVDLSGRVGTGASNYLAVSISGLLGGHSGVDINRGPLNAIHGLVRILQAAAKRVSIQVGSIDGGDRPNAIPREAKALITFPLSDEKLLTQAISDAADQLVAQFRTIERDMKISVEPVKIGPGLALTPSQTVHLLHYLAAIPSGVIAMSQDLPGLVETSTNFGVISTGPGSMDLVLLSRSSVSYALDDVTATLVGLGALSNAVTIPSPAFPGWKPDPSSPALAILKATYKNIFGRDAEVMAVHAGLECGVLNAKIPGLDIVSFGPTIVGAHSTSERVHIGSVVKFYRLLVETLSS